MNPGLSGNQDDEFRARGKRGFPALRGLLALFLLALSAEALPAQSRFDHGDYEITNWSAEDGLPSNVIRALAQTPDGRLWIGTTGGLASFDGRRFLTFETDLLAESGGPRISALQVDSTGKLWIIGQDGTLASHERGHFNLIDRQAGRDMRALIETPDGEIWIGGEGSFRWTRDGPRDTDGPWVRNFRVGHRGRLWAANSEGLHQQRDSGWVKAHDLPGASMVSLTEGGVIGHAPSVITVFTDDGVRRIIPPGGRSWKPWSALEDGQGEHWWASPTGLFHLNSGLLADGSDLSGLLPVFPVERSSEVRTVLRSSDGAIWIGTERRGIFRIRKRLGRLVSSRDAGFAPLRNGESWSIDRNRLTRRRGVQIVEEVELDRQLNWISPARDGGLWIASPDRLLHHGDGGSSPVELPDELATSTHRGPVFEDRLGRLWWQAICFKDGKVLRRESGACVGRTRDGDLLLWNDDRLDRIELDGPSSVLVAADMLGARVRWVHEDEEGRFWIATYGNGLWRLAGDSLSRLTKAHGLPSNYLCGIAGDPAGRLWISSNRGCFVVSLDDLNRAIDQRSYIASARIVSNIEGNTGPLYPSPDGMIHLVTVEGYLAFDPEDLPPLPDVPRPQIDSVEYGRRVALRPESLELPLGVRSARFSFSAAMISESRNLQFLHRLAGLDSSWTHAGDSGEAVYPTIPPGEYEFIVRVLSPGDLEGESARVRLIVPPYFHETSWFRWGLGILLVAAALGVVRFRELTLRRYNTELAGEVRLRSEAEEHARTVGRRLIQAIEDEDRRIASQLHDDIGQRMALLTIGLETSQGPEDRARLSAQAREIARDIQKTSHSLHPNKLNQLGLVRALRSLAREANRAGGPTVGFRELDVAAEAEKLDNLTGLVFYRVAQESLSNALRHAGAESILMTLSRKGPGLCLTIEDDGKGFDSPRTTSDGLGLMMMIERADAVGGTCEVESESEQGTTIRVCVPFPRKSDLS